MNNSSHRTEDRRGFLLFRLFFSFIRPSSSIVRVLLDQLASLSRFNRENPCLLSILDPKLAWWNLKKFAWVSIFEFRDTIRENEIDLSVKKKGIKGIVTIKWSSVYEDFFFFFNEITYHRMLYFLRFIEICVHVLFYTLYRFEQKSVLKILFEKVQLIRKTNLLSLFHMIRPKLILARNPL